MRLVISRNSKKTGAARVARARGKWIASGPLRRAEPVVKSLVLHVVMPDLCFKTIIVNLLHENESQGAVVGCVVRVDAGKTDRLLQKSS